MSNTDGVCPKCQENNPYAVMNCNFCGARLPWADALHDDRIKRLQAEEQARQAQVAAQAAAQRASASSPAPQSSSAAAVAAMNDKICTSCGHYGVSAKRNGGVNLMLFIFLFCAGILPALIYMAILASSPDEWCPI